MKLNKAFGSLFLLASLVFVSPVFAGGSMASLYADGNPLSGIDGINGRVIRVYLNPGYPCKGSEVTFKFVEPKDGDLINTGGSGPVFIFQEDRVDTNCSTYAKYFSKVFGERKVTVEIKNNGSFMISPPIIRVDFDGQYHSDNAYNDYGYRSSTDSPYPAWLYNPQPTNEPAPSAVISARLLEQRFIGQNRREVTVKWGAFDGHSGTFTIYAKTSNKNDWDEKFDGSKGPSATFNLKANQDYQIKVHGCMDKFGTCVDSNIINLPGAKNDVAYQEFHAQNANPSFSPAPTVKNNNVDELNKKVENLQNQLDQSKKTQGLLEQRINDLVNFIKRLFPFFK